MERGKTTLPCSPSPVLFFRSDMSLPGRRRDPIAAQGPRLVQRHIRDVMVLNSGTEELKSWKVFIGFQHSEILVSVDGAQVVDADDFPIRVGKNGTTITGYPNTDLKTAIETAADFTQIQANDPKFKTKVTKTKFMPRQYGDLSLTYDVLQAYEGYYQAQVTMDNFHPLGRLDHWNLTWEWMRGEFIYTMRGAYTHKKDSSDCIYGPQGQYYQSFDFTPVMNCERKPIIADLPAERVNDDKVGKLPYCCRNGSLLPTIMNETQSRSIFQLQVQKMPPDLNRTAFYPPQRWKINGVLNPEYKCGPPIRIDPTEFSDTSGLAAKSYAVASWQVTCNITKPKPKQNRCCVSFSAYYADAAVPCPTCACGCDDDLVHDSKCDPDGAALPIPPESLLVPFANRTTKTKAWAALKHRTLPKKLPCPDNCGVSINWHVNTDYKSGWTARMTLFNWEADPFQARAEGLLYKRVDTVHENYPWTLSWIVFMYSTIIVDTNGNI
ncbi:hypothetical protein RHGRI_009515 [Rhododendron griersonianum]|uniref:COBRA C-terminal domain-containing protein n=1 Tax=Rhododendron griersonianum TaxID=479676 RepID=A0AAV6KF15_9ERIC|nr:hypothetical protein RHGRI_009515 [Rhododendron griersonianum]